MIYISGTANSLADLKASLVAQLAANGYTWNSSTNVVYKGNSAAKLIASGSGVNEVLSIQAGTSADGSGNLVNPSVAVPVMRAGRMGATLASSITWPANYRLFIYTNPDLWVLALNHDTVFWQYMMNGITRNLGCTGIGGVVPFFYASFKALVGTNNLCNMATSTSNGSGTNSSNSCIPFYTTNSSGQTTGDNAGAYINEPLAFNGSVAMAWAPTGQSGTEFLQTAQLSWKPNVPESPWSTVTRLPNAWNQDAQLVPLRILVGRASGFFSPAFEIPHIRLTRNDYYTDGQVVSYGPDQWMVLPARKKDPTLRRAADLLTIDSSGTFAMAFEYTGS